MLTLKNFIDGKYVDAVEYIDSFNPSTGKVWARVPRSQAVDIERAVEVAKKAFNIWSNTSPRQRSDILNKIADLLESRLEEFAFLESCDQGKPIWLARTVEIPRAVLNFRTFAASLLSELNISSQLTAAPAFNYTMKTPVGVAGLITPWNLPLYLLTFKIAPAIAAGNTVVAKPSEMTSVTAWKLCGIFNEAGLPAGVVNVVFGFGAEAGDAMARHPDVPLISFTGSTETAKKIRLSAAPFCKRFSFELGGKNPGIIFPDIDLDECIPTIVRSSFQNQGEICLCTSRLFIHRDIYARFMEKFLAAARRIKVGNPREEGIFMGALISKEHLNKVRGYIKQAVEVGGTIECGGCTEDIALPEEFTEGYFMLPTVISGVGDHAQCMQEEIFGPVVCVTPFSDTDEVIRRANDVQYGLCASVWCKDSSTLHRVSQQLKVGTVWVNCWLVRDLNMPFGGVKQSGTGRESTHDSFDFYTDKKTICVKI